MGSVEKELLPDICGMTVLSVYQRTGANYVKPSSISLSLMLWLSEPISWSCMHCCQQPSTAFQRCLRAVLVVDVVVRDWVSEATRFTPSNGVPVGVMCW